MRCRPHIAYLDCAPVPRTIPVTEGDLNLLTYKTDLLLGLQTPASSLGPRALPRAAFIGKQAWPLPQTARECVPLQELSLLIFSCLASHSCRSSSRSRFSSSWKRNGQSREAQGCSGGTRGPCFLIESLCQGHAAFTSRSRSGKKLVSTSGFFPIFLFFVVISGAKEDTRSQQYDGPCLRRTTVSTLSIVRGRTSRHIT